MLLVFVELIKNMCDTFYVGSTITNSTLFFSIFFYLTSPIKVGKKQLRAKIIILLFFFCDKKSKNEIKSTSKLNEIKSTSYLVIKRIRKILCTVLYISFYHSFLSDTV